VRDRGELIFSQISHYCCRPLDVAYGWFFRLRPTQWSANLLKTRLPSNLRPATRMHSHFRSRDKDGGHAIRHIRNSHATRASYSTRKLHGSASYRTKVIADGILYCRNRDFRPFLLLWPWPWPDNLYIRTWPVLPKDIPDVQIWTYYVKAFESYRLTDRDTRPKLYTTPLRGWSIQVAQLSQRDCAAGWVSYGQKRKTGTGRQYFTDITGLSSTTVT